MNATLKTYEDGSEFTVAHLGVAIAAGAVLAAVGAYAVVKYDNWSSRRIARKYATKS